MSPWSALHLARQLMDAHGLREWRFTFNRRKRSMGLCRFEHKSIELSWHFVTRNHEPQVRDTILHEIAHALAGPNAGHGPHWQQLCRQLGAAPRRCGEADMPRGRWQATCPGCGQEHHRYRRPDRARKYYCKPCGSVRGRLHFKTPRLVPRA